MQGNIKMLLKIKIKALLIEGLFYCWHKYVFY
jgi:hypothetical protein